MAQPPMYELPRCASGPCRQLISSILVPADQRIGIDGLKAHPWTQRGFAQISKVP
jgi:hypothetical protein